MDSRTSKRMGRFRSGAAVLCAIFAVTALWPHRSRAQCAWDWINPRPIGNKLRQVAYSDSLDLRVVVGDAGSILTSPDGMVWTIRESGFHGAITDILWMGSRFVAVTTFGSSLTSADGASWVEHPVPTPGFFANALAFDGTTLVAVAYGGKIFTSSDGMTWSLETSGTTDELADVLWDGSRFVAITTDGDVLTSPNGTVWTSTATTGIGMNALAWNGSLYVAAGFHALATSPDAITWTPQTPPASQNYTDVTWNGASFLATSDIGFDTARSTDGVVWEAVAAVGRLNGVTWDGSQFVAVGFSGRIVTSPTGAPGSWTDRFTTPVSPANNAFNDVHWDGAMFYATLANRVFASADGQLWTDLLVNLALNLGPVASSGSTIVAVDVRGTAIHYHASSDGGQTWTTTVSTHDSSLLVRDILWTGSQFIAVGSERRFPGTGNFTSLWPYYAVSTDGIAWTETVLTSADVVAPDAASGGGGGFRGIAFNGSRLVAVGGRVLVDSSDPVNSPVTGLIMFSDDGGMSFQRSLPESSIRRNSAYADVVWDGTKFVVIESQASLGAVWSSSSADDESWALHPTSFSDDSTFIAIDRLNSAGDLAIVGTPEIGGATPFYRSPDGMTWTTTEYFPSEEIAAIATNGTRVVAGGRSATILSTDCFSPSGLPQAQLVSPAPGSTLTSGSATFGWDAKGNMPDHWILRLGSSPGASDIDASGLIPGGESSFTFNGLPTDGSTLYARLIMDLASVQTTQDDEAYTAWTAPPTATLITPTPGTTLEDNSETFAWDPMGVDPDHWVVWIGTTQGGDDLVTSGLIPAGTTSFGYNALPTDGTPVWVRLWAEESAALTLQDDASYDTAFPTKAQILSPRPGSVLGETSITVTWNLTGFDAADKPRLEIFDETFSFSASSSSLPPGTTHHTFTRVFTGDPDETFANFPVDGRPLRLQLRKLTDGNLLVAQDLEEYLAFTPADFYTLAPCRVIDTRKADGPLGGPALEAGLTRTFPVAETCDIPLTARAVSVNIAVTQSTEPGNVRLFPAGNATPTVSSINYATGATRSNNGVIGLSSFGELSAFVGQASGTVHLILDVNGYFQ